MSKELSHAKYIADKIAKLMKYFPMLLRTTPPRLLDIDEAFSKTRYMTNFHIPATNPRDEGGAQSGPQ